MVLVPSLSGHPGMAVVMATAVTVMGTQTVYIRCRSVRRLITGSRLGTQKVVPPH